MNKNQQKTITTQIENQIIKNLRKNPRDNWITIKKNNKEQKQNW